VEVVKALVRFCSYLFHAVLAIFLIAVSLVALSSGLQALHLDMLPWTGATLIHFTLFGGLFGLLTVVLATMGTWRVLFFLWSLAVTVLMIKGYIFSGYHFEPGEFRTALYLIAGSILALLGAWFQLRSKPAGRRRVR
jgi:hypothetical protein